MQTDKRAVVSMSTTIAVLALLWLVMSGNTSYLEIVARKDLVTTPLGPLSAISRTAFLLAIAFPLYLFIKTIVFWGETLRAGDAQPFVVALAVYAVSFFWFAVLWYNLYPGSMDSDILYTRHMVTTGYFDGWYSWLHPVVISALTQVSPVLGGATILSANFIAITIGYITFTFIKNQVPVWVAVICGLTLALYPLGGLMAIKPNRDAFFTCFAIYTLLGTWKLLRRGEASKGKIAFLAIVAAVTAYYRTDGMVIGFGAILAVCVAARLLTVRHRAVIFIAFVVAFGSLSVGLPRLLLTANPGMGDRSAEYEATGLLNALATIVSRPFYVPDPEQAVKDIERLVPIAALRNEPSFCYTNVLSRGEVRSDPTAEDRAAFRRAALLIFLNNPGPFLANRFEMFVQTIGLGGHCGLMGNTSRELMAELGIQEMVGFEPSDWTLRFQDAFQSVLSFKGITGGRLLFLDYAPFLLILIIIAFCYPLAPATASIAAIVLLRTLAVALTAPASAVFYYYVLFFAGVLCTGLFIAERKSPSLQLKAR